MLNAKCYELMSFDWKVSLYILLIGKCVWSGLVYLDELVGRLGGFGLDLPLTFDLSFMFGNFRYTVTVHSCLDI